MSKLIKNFKPTKLKPSELEDGIRYLDESPQQKDFLGQDLNVGDFIVYASSGDYAGSFRVGKVIGISTKITPAKEGVYYRDKDRLETVIAVALTHRWGGGTNLNRLSTSSRNVVKITPEQVTDETFRNGIKEA